MQRLHVSIHVRRSGCKDLETTCSDARIGFAIPRYVENECQRSYDSLNPSD